MKIELQIIPDCPQAGSAYNLLRQALDDLGQQHTPITTTVIADDAHAHRSDFHGSPTFTVDGNDLFTPPASAPAWACRLYATGSGLAPLPELGQLRDHLKQATRS